MAGTGATADETSGSPLPGPGAIPQLGPWIGFWASLAAALLVTMGEVDRLIAQSPDRLGRSWSLANLMGPSRIADHSAEGWVYLSKVAHQTHAVAVWSAAYLILDVAFIGVYALLGWRLLRQSAPGQFRSRLVGKVLLALAATDLLEDVLAALALRGAALASTYAPWLTSAKWVAAVALVLSVVVRLSVTPWGRWPHLLRSGLYIQRYSVLIMLPILLLGVLPGANLLDQLPDVERRWADGVWPAAHAWWALALIYLVAVLAFFLGRFRSEFAWQRYQSGPGGFVRPDPPDLGMWFIGPAILAVAAIVLWAIGVPGIGWLRLAVFCLVPALIGLLSMHIRAALQPDATSWFSGWIKQHAVRKPKDPLSRDEFRAVVLAGDAIAVLVLIIGGASLVRAFTAPVALMVQAQTPARFLPVLFLVLGWAGMLASWFPACRLMARIVEWGLRGQEVASPRRTLKDWLGALLTPGVPTRRGKVRVALFVGSIVALGATSVLAGPASRWFGVVGCLLIALTCLAVLVGSMVVIAQDGGAPHMFWLPLIRCSSPPITTLLVVAVFLAGMAGGHAEIHGVRGLRLTDGRVVGQNGDQGTTAVVRTRPSMDALFDTWLASTAGCDETGTVDSGGSAVQFSLRPMLLVAAEGGGIRAAYWTAAGLDAIAGRGQLGGTTSAGSEICDKPMTLLSGGASGGAVGLTASSLARGTSGRADVTRMADPDMLGIGSVGLMLRDLIYAATGLPLPSNETAPGAGLADNWLDRAALMEEVWEEKAAGLADPFLDGDATSMASRPTGALVLNSTSVANGCRLWVSQVDLGPSQPTQPKGTEPSPSATPSATANADRPGSAPAPASDAAPARASCSDLGQPGPESLDLLATYGSASGDGQSDPGCLGDLNGSTAALMASRFPYVTPSGVIGPCGTWARQQLVDGGYVENTGIGTVIDLAPQWLARVQAFNAASLAQYVVLRGRGAGLPPGTPVPRAELIVPIVVYLDNGTGSDLREPTQQITNEILVPPVTSKRAGKAQSDTSALLKRAADLVSADELVGRTQPRQDMLSSRVPLPPPAIEEAKRLAAEAISNWRKQPVMVVHQSAFPAVTAPLGWVLSKDSMDTMDRAMAQQATTSCDDQKADALCARGYGSLADLLALLGRQLKVSATP